MTPAQRGIPQHLHLGHPRPRTAVEIGSACVTLPAGFLVDGRYEVRGSLGNGTYGEVYEVFDHTQHQVVALKLLDPTKCGPWPWHEAVQLTRLRSEYILPVWNASIANGVPYIVTEVARNGTADRICSSLPGVTPAQAIRCARDAARGISRTHDDGVLHRDIKLENLFVGEDGGIRVGDFGTAHPLNNGRAPNHGTAVTMAPEVLFGGDTTKASDIYSLGCCLYRILTGWYPYIDQNPQDVDQLRALVGAGPPTPIRDLAPHITRGLASRVNRALAHAPDARHGSAAELDSELGALPTAQRNWRQAPTHQGHARCWESVPPPGDGLRVCVVPSGRHYELDVARVTSGRRIRAACRGSVVGVSLPGALRATFEHLGN